MKGHGWDSSFLCFSLPRTAKKIADSHKDLEKKWIFYDILICSVLILLDSLKHLWCKSTSTSNLCTFCTIPYVWNKLPKLLQQFCNVFLSWRIVAVNSYENTTLSVSLGHYHLCAQDVCSLNLFNSMLQTPFSRCHPSLIHVICDVSGDQLLAKLHNPSAAGNRWCHYCPGSETLSSWLTP